MPIIYSDDQVWKTKTPDTPEKDSHFPGVQCVHFPNNDKNKEMYFAVFLLIYNFGTIKNNITVSFKLLHCSVPCAGHPWE